MQRAMNELMRIIINYEHDNQLHPETDEKKDILKKMIP